MIDKPTGRLVFHVFSALAQFEREIIIERSRAGVAAARAGEGRGATRCNDPGQTGDSTAVERKPGAHVGGDRRRNRCQQIHSCPAPCGARPTRG